MKKIHLIILYFLLPIWGLQDFAQTPSVTPIMEYTDKDGNLTQNTTYSGNAPFKPQFLAQVNDIGEYTGYYEWRFYKEEDESDEPFLIRYDEDTEYEFLESGSFHILFYARFTCGNDTIEYSPEDYDTQNLTVSISTSILQMPNAFSPNGDDKNEYYQAKTTIQSIVEFKGTIFNRWGQKLYTWTDPYTKEAGWDGKYNGKDVAQGVYFCRVDAKGADGVEYHIKRDVNLLRGYDQENGSSSSGSED